MPHLTHDDISLHYELTSGPPGAPWLFFSHSLGADLAMWQPQVEAFSNHFSVLRYDTRGHGKSSIPPGPCTLAQLGADALALADHVGADRFHYCGLSLGGLTAQWLGIHAPQRLLKLVLSNTAAKIGTAEGWAQRTRVVQAGGMAAIVETGLQRWFTPRVFSNRPETIQRFRSVILRTPPEGYIANCAALGAADLRDAVSSISAPTLVVCATHDPVTTIADAQFLTAAIPGSRMLELDAAHISNVEQADAFNAGVIDFLLANPA